MEFALQYEIQKSRPHYEGFMYDIYHQATEQVVRADALGYHSVWTVEHHFLSEWSYSSAPEVFLAACTQRTKHVRIGHGIVQMPPNINHPARVAERIATLDLISDGRVDYGIGAGSSETELGGFGVPQAEKKAMMLDDGLRAFV